VRAKKLFHIVTGIWFAGMVVNLTYLAGAMLYVWITGTDPESSGPVWLVYPRFAMILSVALPLAFGISTFGHRRYVAIGTMIFGLLAFVCWLLIGTKG